MNEIRNDKDMRSALEGLDIPAQRVVAARFIQNVLPLTDDERVTRAVETASRGDASEDELKAAHRAANAAALDAHARCGADSKWEGQSPYFVARAAEAATGPHVFTAGKSLAWAVAMQCRMASCCLSSADEADNPDNTCNTQRRILTDYLNS